MSELGSKLAQQQLKTILASLPDKDIRRLVDRYIQCSGQQLDKNCHEISYKCFEASSSIRNKRANGFGRNQQQAITNSIKNLLELLLEDDKSASIIKDCIRKNCQSLSTDEDKQNVVKIQLDMSKYERRSVGGKLSQPLSSNSTFMNMSINDEINKSKSRLKNGVENLSISALKLTQPHITLEKTQSNIEKVNGSVHQEELRKAKSHIAMLQAKLKAVLDENAVLKVQLQKVDTFVREPRKDLLASSVSYVCEKLRSTSVEGYKHNLNMSTSIEPANNLNCSMAEDKKKSKVPRLKLEILPNYHGKSNKCINPTLLAAYQEKHGAKKS